MIHRAASVSPRVAQPVSIDTIKTAAFGSVGNNLGHRAAGESMMRRFDPHEYCPAMCACRTAVAQVRSHCFADIRGQRESFGTVGFTVHNDDLAGSPIDIIELKLGDFTRSQPRRTSMVKTAKSRQPLRVLVSQDTRRHCTWSGANPLGGPVNRRPGTDGTIETSDRSMAPST